ncbi:hypothetical protein COBT_000156 [Conglomerata obtusa]
MTQFPNTSRKCNTYLQKYLDLIRAKEMQNFPKRAARRQDMTETKRIRIDECENIRLSEIKKRLEESRMIGRIPDARKVVVGKVSVNSNVKMCLEKIIDEKVQMMRKYK